MSVSLWQRPARCDTTTADIAILGAGIAGLSAAAHLADRGVDAVVIDRGPVGGGASTRNAGYLMRGAADNYAAAVRTYGRDRARSLWRLTEQNLADLRALGAESLPTFRDRPSCLLALTDAEADELRASHDLLIEDGFASSLIETHTDAPWRLDEARVGLVNPGDAVVNPAELIGLLASRSPRPVVTGAEVYAVDRDADGLTVRASTITVRARRCLVTLNAYAPALFPELAGWVTPNRGQMVALRAPEPALSFAYYANRGGEYVRRVDGETVVVGGWRKRFEHAERTDSDATTAEVQAGLEGFAERFLAARYPVTARWAGTMGFSATGLPIIAPIGGDDRLVACVGFTGHGMSMGHRSARVAADVLLGEAGSPFPPPPDPTAG